MNLLLLGSGGREHAIAWKCAKSKLCDKLFIAPGNAGTTQAGTNVKLDLSDFEAIKAFCVDEKIDMVIVGPEEPLVNGIADSFATDDAVKHINVIGPSREAAQLEGSKSFAKQFMVRHKIPTAAYREFDDTNYGEGIPYLQQHALPIVLKADGLAAGKGVIICQSHIEAISEYELMIHQHKFGDASKKVVVEEFLDGIEMSVFVLCDGKNHVILPQAKDYKRINEGDKGPNTGGMGAVSPVPFADTAFMKKINERIIIPTVEGLKKDKIEYKGFIFIGIIKVNDEPLVIEYNCRMGDPETEVVIPRLKNDLVELFNAVGNKSLDKIKIEEDPRTACTVMAVSEGYPGNYEKGIPIKGLEIKVPDVMVFHAGTTEKEGKVVTNGGRVLCVTSYGENIEEAVSTSLEMLGIVEFDGMFYRQDIGYEFR
ncbi:MAG: phosphoribosylamine--glycine ligase [Chitinophagaceae bacterium]|nr:phosphoribosylamine--glycine ligase [Chitinophagaceae bacterium]